MNKLLLLGLNHLTAPLAVREKLAFSAEERLAALASLRHQFAGSEAVILSTCNRVELYVSRPVHGHPRHEEMTAFVASIRDLPPQDFNAHVYAKADRDAVAHLFSVASSLDSMVIGETQILGQVREAYEFARSANAVGADLNPLFQRALAVGKQVVNETKIAEGRASLGGVAVSCAQRIFDHFDDKTILCIGAGKMAGLVLRGLANLKPKRLLVCNRDGAKADALAQRFGGEAVSFEKLDDHLVAADIVVSSTGSQQPIVTRARFEPLLRLRRYRPIFFIDIALPRDVEPGVGEVKNVYLYNLDDLQQIVSTTHSQRSESIDQARSIVTAHVEEFLVWQRTREMGPLIDQLFKRHHQLAREELERTLSKFSNLSEAERAHLEDLARRIVNKLLHDPIAALRNSDPAHAPGGSYVHALQKLFQLEIETPPEEADEPPQS